MNPEPGTKELTKEMYLLMSKVLNGSSKEDFSKLPYTYQQFRQHINVRLKANMNWENYGTVWYLDHCIPVKYFSYSSHRDTSFKRCWGKDNLIPRYVQTTTYKSNILIY